MYKVNGVNLDNDTFEWRLLRRSQPLTSIEKSLTTVSIPGRNGVLSGVPTFKNPVSTTLVVRCPSTSIETLYAVFELNGGVGVFSLAADSTREAVFELASINPQGINAEDELVNVSITIRFPSADWRDVNTTVSSPETPSGPVYNTTALTGIGSNVTDADIFIGGNFGNFELLDEGSGSWLKQTWRNSQPEYSVQAWSRE